MTLTRTSQSVAQLGSSHGYRLEGDLAFLNAEILCDESRLTGQEWALQLCTDKGIKFAELPLGLLNPNGTGCIVVSGSSYALPPAGEGPHLVSMVLVSGFDGALDTVEDFASYEQAVSFLQPRMGGTICSGFTNDEITFDIARIENPRDGDNISGTLALELWALDSEYAGGDWTGVPVASLVLGSLSGQTEWTDCHVTTHAGPLPEAGHLTLMLREWTPAGYVTRDFRALARPSGSPAKAEKATKATAEKKAKAPAEAKTKAAEKAAPVAAAAAPVAEKAKAAAPVAAAAAAATPGVSINTASAAELSDIKGVSNALAKAIVAGRPYAKLDDVVSAKGMGEKLLKKIRASLKL